MSSTAFKSRAGLKCRTLCCFSLKAVLVAARRALNKLPHGSSSAVEIPDLQPNYVGDQNPKMGADSFTIKSWQLQRQRYLLTKAGGSVIMDKIGQGSTASWQFFNVTVEPYKPPDCFAAAVVQVRGAACHGVWVSGGLQQCIVCRVGRAVAVLCYPADVH